MVKSDWRMVKGSFTKELALEFSLERKLDSVVRR